MEKNRLLLVLAALFWGIGFLGVEGALNSGWDTFAILFMRGIIAGILLLSLACRYNKEWYKNKQMIRTSILGGILMWLAFVLQIYGQKASSISVASILTALYVLFTPLIGSIFLKQKHHKHIYLACLVAFLAVVLTSYNGETMSFGWGEILLVICASISALHILLIENLMVHQIALAGTGIQLITMAVCSLPLMLITGQRIQLVGLEYVLFLAIFCSGLAFFLQVYCQQHVPPAVASVILSFESIFGVIGAIILFAEPFTWQVVTACLLMIFAIWLSEYRKTVDSDFLLDITDESDTDIAVD